MPIDTAAPDDEVTSALWNETAGLINGTANYGVPVKLYQYNNASTYSLTVGNQDTTAGLIAAFQYGTVGAATTVAQITRQGIIGKLRDNGGWTFTLDGFTTSTINNLSGGSSVTASDAAWTAAFSAVTAVGGGVITLGPGTYLAPSAAVTNWVSNTIIRGAGMDATTIIHPNASAKEPIFFYTLSNCGVADLTIDGNRTNNNNATTGFNNCEVSIDGTDCWAFRIRVKDFNKNGISMSGSGNSVINCKVGLTTAVSSYTAEPTKDYGGAYGISTGGVSGEQRLLVCGNEVYHLRSAGIFVGGTKVVVDGNIVYDCHRGLYGGAGGGQVAVAPTGPGAVVRSTWISITNNQIGPTTVGGLASGIELNSCDYIAVANNNIDSCPGVGGIVLDQAPTHVSISGGTIKSCAVGLNILNTAATSVTLFGVVNVSFVSNTLAINITDAANQFSFDGCRFVGNTTNWTSATTGVVWNSEGHVVVNGGHVPQQWYRSVASQFTHIVKNGSATGYGLQVWGGNTASEYALQVMNYSGSQNLMVVFGSGQVNITGTMFIGGTSNAKSTLGLTINQAGNDDEILSIKSSDVAHGMTTLTETDTYGFLQKVSATQGGVKLAGYTAGSIGALVIGTCTTENSDFSNTGVGMVTIDTATKSGTTSAAPSAGKSLVVVRSGSTARFMLDSDGSSHQDVGTAWTNFDGHDDLALLTSLSHEVARPDNPIGDEFGRYLAYNREQLADLGVVQFNDGPGQTGHAFVNMSQLLFLTVGAVRQAGLKIEGLQQQIRSLPSGAERSVAEQEER